MPAGIAGTAVRRAEWAMDTAHGRALEMRGTSVEMAVRHGWRACVGPTDDLWFAIPYVDQGERVGTKYRTIGGNKLITQEPGSAQILWNIDCLRKPELAGYPLVITEGEIDALSA